MDYRTAYDDYDDSPALENEIKRRELYLYGERKLSRYSDDYYLPPSESFHHMPYPDERLRYPRHLPYHPYFHPERFPLPKGLAVVPSYHSYPDGSPNYQRSRLAKEDRLYSSKNVYKGYSSRLTRKSVKAEMLPDRDDFPRLTIKLEENVKEPGSCIEKYCLDRQTQDTLKSLQEDFRLTKKYKTFNMYESPLIDDFKPTPSTTDLKFNSRFKCLPRPELEKAIEEKDVPEKVAEVTKNKK